MPIRPVTFPKPPRARRPPIAHRFFAYIVGELRRNARGEWVLVAIDVKSEARPTFIDNLRWCNFGDPTEGPSFEAAKRAAMPQLVQLRQLFFGSFGRPR